MNALRTALHKELLLQWRNRSHLLATFGFGAAALFLFSFSGSPDAPELRRHAAGFLWLGLLLSSTLTLAEGFHREMESRALEGLLLLPVPPAALFYAKAIANCAQLALLGVALLPVMIGLYDAGSDRPFALAGVIVLGAAGLAAPGTLYVGMTSQTKGGQLLLPLLLFPLVVPDLIAGANATALLILGDPLGQLGSWIVLLVGFDVLYWLVCGLMFGRVVEE
jgi:heme exporter protein B